MATRHLNGDHFIGDLHRNHHNPRSSSSVDTQPTLADLDQVIASHGVFRNCSDHGRQLLRQILERQRDRIELVEMTTRYSVFPREHLPVDHLYYVLEGRLSVQWESGGDRAFSLDYYSTDDLFGEVQCALFGPVQPLNLRVRCAWSRRMRRVRLLEFPKSMVDLLLEQGEFRRLLEACAFSGLRRALLRVRPLLLGVPALTIAELCISSSGGTEHRHHATLRRLGERVVLAKSISREELCRLSGLTSNTVVKWLKVLQRQGLIQVMAKRPNLTTIVVRQPEGLLDLLTLQS